MHISLNPDPYTDITIAMANTATFPGFAGVLDAGGRATAALVVPPVSGMPPTLRLDHAYVVIDSGRFVLGSKPVYVILR